MQASPQRSMRAGRLARAAVFAGASLAGCDQGAKPAPKESVVAPLTASRLQGVVSANGGGPLANAYVELRGANKNTRTDAKGRYLLEEIPKGSFELYVAWDGNDGTYGNQQQQVDLHEPRAQHLDVILHISHVAMPYGAPPARRRVV